jgi:hypothetical protein
VLLLLAALRTRPADAEQWPTLEEFVEECVLIVRCRTDERDIRQHRVLETWKGQYSPELFVTPPPDGFVIADDAHGNANPVGGREIVFFYTRHNQPASGKLQSHSTALPIAGGKVIYAPTSDSLRKEYSIGGFRVAVFKITSWRYIVSLLVAVVGIAFMVLLIRSCRRLNRSREASNQG